MEHVPEGGLDLSASSDLQCSPNKLRVEVERLYMGMLMGLLSFVKSVVRLRSWNEPRRTALFCTAYFTAWLLDHLVFTILCVTIALITSTRVRRFLLPPAPMSMINIVDGNLAKPMAGTLGSTDTATGAPQNLRGESLENEASNFVTSFAAIAANLLTGQDPHGAPYDATAGQGGVIAHMNMGTLAVAKDKAEGMNRPSEDKTKTPMEESISAQTTPMLHMMISMSDTWERVANILTPTPPFDREGHQRRLALFLCPLVMASTIVTRDIAVQAFTFAFGVALFGQPLFDRAQDYIRDQEWEEVLHPFNFLLRGVPTNLQLALTLLRLGEANGAPFPPAVGVHKLPPDEAIDLDDDVLSASLGDDPLGESHQTLRSIAEHDKDMADDAGGADNEMKQAGGHGQKREKVFNVIKEGARGVVKVAAAADKLRGMAGAPHSKLRAGVLPSSYDQPKKLGPVEFSARFDGKKGYVYVDSTAGVPSVSFNRRSVDKTGGDENGEEEEEEKGLRCLWKVRIDDIKRLRKHSGYGLKTKLGVGWAINGGVQDGLRIVDTEDNEWVVTALPHRDALFNRLCAISETAKWEIC